MSTARFAVVSLRSQARYVAPRVQVPIGSLRAVSDAVHSH